MDNLFDNGLFSDENHKLLKDELPFEPFIPELKLEPAVETTEETASDDDGVDLYNRWALLDVVESNPSLMLPTILPGPADSQDALSSTQDFFNTPGTKFMYIQMPNVMPHLDKERTLQEDKDAVSDDAGMCPEAPSNTGFGKGNGEPPIYQTSKVGCLPSGKLGKLRIHKSGKIKLHVGNHVFNFTPGNNVSCKQQVGCFMEKNNEFLFLGNYRKKFVVSPDFSDMLKQRSGHET